MTAKVYLCTNIKHNYNIYLGLSRTVSLTNGDFRRKLPIFPTTVYFAPPLKGFPLELGIGAESEETRVMGLPDGRKKF